MGNNKKRKPHKKKPAQNTQSSQQEDIEVEVGETSEKLEKVEENVSSIEKEKLKEEVEVVEVKVEEPINLEEIKPIEKQQEEIKPNENPAKENQVKIIILKFALFCRSLLSKTSKFKKSRRERKRYLVQKN